MSGAQLLCNNCPAGEKDRTHIPVRWRGPSRRGESEKDCLWPASLGRGRDADELLSYVEQRTPVLGMRGVARELGTQPTFVKQPASQRTQVLCLGSRTCGDQLASRMLMQDFSIVAEETAWCMGVPERRPHPVKRQLAQTSPLCAEGSRKLSCQEHSRPQCP